MSTIAKKVKELKPPKFKVRARNRCRVVRPAARVHAQVRSCAASASAKLALEGAIAGVTKSSW